MITPRNEIETVILFSQLCANQPDIEIISFDGTYPDAKVLWKGQVYRTEFEFVAFNFYMHKHDPLECDLIICYQNDYPDSILPIVSLDNSEWASTEIILVDKNKKLANYWKKRAIEAETRLERLDKRQSGEMINNLESVEDEEVIIRMTKDRMSGKVISETVWGIGKYGQFYNARIRRVLDRHGIQSDHI